MPVVQKQVNYEYSPECELMEKAFQGSYYIRPRNEKKMGPIIRFPIKIIDPEPIISDHDFSLEGKYVSEETYWEEYYTDTPYEWNNGRLEVKPLSDYSAHLLSKFINALLLEYERSGFHFQSISSEIGFTMYLKKGKKVRKPDVGIIGPNSLKMKGKDRSYKGTFDLCIEYLSDSRPSEVKRDTEIKFKEYEEAGVTEFFILDRNETHTAFYRLKNKKYQPIDTSDGVVRSEVLKGFQFRVNDLYSRPSIDDLMHDPVYKHYVLLSKQEEIKRANNEKKRADEATRREYAEKKRADDEKKRADDEKKRADEATRLLEAYQQKIAALGVQNFMTESP